MLHKMILCLACWGYQHHYLCYFNKLSAAV